MIDETIARQAPALRDPSSALGQSEDLGGSGGFTPGALSSTRSEILAAHAEARLNERHRLALAYLRLALMADLLECLWFEDPAEAARLAHFCEECLAKLDFDLGEDEETEITQWILETTGARWGEFLHLLDEEKKPSVDAGRTRRSGSPCDRSSLSIDALQRDDGIALASKGKIDREVEAHAAGKSDDQVFASLLGFGGELDDYRSSQGDAGFGIPDSPRRVTIDPEFADTFLDEANDLFERIQGLVLSLSPGKDPRRTLLELGRCFHTLKGAAGSVGLVEFSGLIHSAEETIESAGAKGEADHRLIDFMHKLLRYMESLFQLIRTGATHQSNPSGQDSATVGESLEHSISSTNEVDAQFVEGPVRVTSERLDELLDLVSELITRRGQWTAQADTLKEFSILAKSSRNRLLTTVDKIQDLRPTKGGALASRGLHNHQTDLPELSRRLAEQADDLLVLTDSARSFTKPLADSSQALAGLTLKIWESLQALRIVPVKGLFQRLARVAYDAARVEGRRIELIMSGEEIGLDRALQDKTFEPLLHIVRNAVAHGIESPRERKAAGKPDPGVVRLTASRSGNTIVLSVGDDGKGLDYRAIESKGRRLGLIAYDETPDVDRLNSLIFQPGFSTKEEANSISGRGVGMDVVFQEVAKIHGTIELTSVPGEGTRISLHLPSRLSLEQAMLARVDGQAFALPVDLIEAVESFNPDMIETRDAKPWIMARDTWAQLLLTREALGIEAADGAASSKLLLIRVEGKPLAVVVDSNDGTCELVIKPLGPLVAGHPVISGTSQLVTGEVVLALNPSGLARWAQLDHRSSLAAATSSTGPAITSILVVDDSISVRKIVTRLLRAMGYRVDEAFDGLEALGKLREHRYAMVVTDIDMPRMDGFELLSEIANHDFSKSIPVMVTSTRTDESTLSRVKQLGARGFLPKPIEADEFKLTITRLIGEHAHSLSEQTAVSEPDGTDLACSSPAEDDVARGLTCDLH